MTKVSCFDEKESKHQVSGETTTIAPSKTNPSPVVVRSDDDEVIFCKKCYQYIGVRELITNNNTDCYRCKDENEKCD